MRAVAGQVERRVDLPFEHLYRPSRAGLGFTITSGDEARRAAWALVSEWLVAASVGAECAAEGLLAAHEWFWTGSGRTLGDVPEMKVSIEVTNAIELRALLPYLLDPMAAATRRDVLNTQSTAQERRMRKASGVYYTPGDVAYLMVQRVLSATETSDRHLWLDPSHGSGVFLRAVLSAIYQEAGGRDRIYGVDLDPLAAETSSFVLTAEDMIHSPIGPAPWERWHQFRRNLATGNALLIDTGSAFHQPTLTSESDGRPVDGHPLGRFEPWRLESVFPETVTSGFARVIANPPYAPLQQSVAACQIRKLHPVTGSTARRDISPVFVELCVGLLPDDGALAVVLPLSVVASTRAPFPDLRQHLAEQPGSLEFLSFDRVPDALFGDDIKTRNAVVHLDKCAPRSLTASPLYRWTSRTRNNALAEIPVMSIADLEGVPYAIPKIGTNWERDLFIACGGGQRYLEHWHTERRLLPLTSIVRFEDDERANVLALAPTAYNFLGVLRDPYRAVIEGHNSQNGFSILHFDSDLHASAAYALLCSRLAFWIWHVTGDGFHVTGTLHRRIPVPTGDAGHVERLADLGDRLWKAALQNPLVSTNRGRTTVAYPTRMYASLVDEIDNEVGAFIGMEYTKRLSEWHEQLVVVDLDSERRNLIRRKTP
ncbi:N-6 DNA methylase [Mycobacterium sp. pV006]|uniref:Eco57I restriction-modification methylase domain-containing protein n=1 Tax=Mycobacterium sp. pV006 TaxID=3238983 RepID=UPI00351AC7BF